MKHLKSFNESAEKVTKFIEPIDVESDILDAYDRNGEVNIELKDNEMYLGGIKVEPIGKKIGQLFLKELFDYFKVDKFYLSSYNHPYWPKIATDTGLGTSGGCTLYTITRDQLRESLVIESVFVSKEDVDNLLDKISSSGITSLSDIDNNRLTLFSEGDKEIIDTIEKMADITNQFRELNAEMRRCQDSGESDGFHLMKDWMKLNDQLRPLEASFRKWGIELGDHRLDKLMRTVRPDAYNRHVIESVSDDSDTMARYQLFGSDAEMAFNFGDKYITNPDEINEILKVYKETYNGWGGGPESIEFIDYFNNKYNTKLSRKTWYPMICLIINTIDYGDIIIGYGIRDKKGKSINWEKLKDEKGSTDEYDKSVLSEIHKIAWDIYKSKTIDDTIRLLNLNVKNKIDWDWLTNESKEKVKKKKRIKRYSQFKVSTDKPFTWTPDFNKNSPAPSSNVSIGPLK